MDTEDWKEFKRIGKELKWKGYERAREKMFANGVDFIEKPNGHFIVYTNGKPLLDFWGTTGLVMIRNSQQRFYGVNNVLRLVAKYTKRGKS